MYYRRFITQVVTGLAVAVLATAVHGTTIYVDDDNCPGPGSGTEADPYCSIQTAIGNAAVVGDEIVVAPGTYFETIDFIGKAVFLHSSGGPEITILDATGLDTSAVKCVTGEGPDTILRGFTITGGSGVEGYYKEGETIGGGMVIVGDYSVPSTPTIVDCVFRENSATYGGGMYLHGPTEATVVNCVLYFNSSGIGLSEVGGSLTAVNCLFVWNSGAAVVAYLGGGPSTLINCTFFGNDVGLFPSPGDTVTNCILWANVWQIYPIVQPSVTYSDVQGSWPGEGNIDVYPLFADLGNDDFRLSPGSACIDGGDNSAVPEDITTDLDGNPRFLEIPETPDTGHGDLPIVDMGAYEALGGGCLAIISQEVICQGDGSTFTVNVEGLNACTGGTTMASFTGSGGAVGEDFCATLLIDTEQGGFCCSTQVCVPVPDCSPLLPPCPCDCADPPDGVVNVVDFLALLAQWGGPGPCDCGDTLDVVVNVLDFLSMLATWGPCP